MLAFVGLGNPGLQYEKTRHNVGFEAVSFLSVHHRGDSQNPSWRRFGNVMVAKGLFGGQQALYIQPQSYMNRSGAALLPVMQFYKITPACLWVFHDDVDLPLGTVRLKRGGSDGGHRGLRSIDAHLGREYARVRLGIGRPECQQEVADFVLRPFLPGEMEQVVAMVALSASAVACAIEEGMAAAQQRYHGLRPPV